MLAAIFAVGAALIPFIVVPWTWEYWLALPPIIVMSFRLARSAWTGYGMLRPRRNARSDLVDQIAEAWTIPGFGFVVAPEPWRLPVVCLLYAIVALLTVSLAVRRDRHGTE
jgi:hypothetical protein